MWGRLAACVATQRVPRLPPLSAAIAAVGRFDNRPQLTKLPHRSAASQMQALLLMNRVGVHFCAGHPTHLLRQISQLRPDTLL